MEMRSFHGFGCALSGHKHSQHLQTLKDAAFGQQAHSEIKLQQHIEYKLHEFASLLGARLPLASVELVGSLRSGLLPLTEALARSLNGYLDIDVLVRLESEAKVSPAVTKRAARCMPGAKVQHFSTERLGAHCETAELRSYQELPGVGTVSWDLHLVDAMYVDIASSWRSLFSQEEIKWQKQARDLAYSSPEPTLYTDTKELQVADAAWRKTAAFAATHFELLPDELRSNLPTFTDLPAPQRDVMLHASTQWREGRQEGFGFFRPFYPVPSALRALFMQQTGTAPDFQESPEWVSRLAKLHWELAGS